MVDLLTEQEFSSVTVVWSEKYCLAKTEYVSFCEGKGKRKMECDMVTGVLMVTVSCYLVQQLSFWQFPNDHT